MDKKTQDQMTPEDYLYPREPSRIEMRFFNQILIHCNTLKASDITLQTDQPIFAEIFGRLQKITRRSLSSTEISEILNGIYGPNGTTQIMSGKDLDTNYEIRPTRAERYRYRVNATGCHVNGHEAIQITLRDIPSTPPPLSSLNLPKKIVDKIAPKEGVVYVTGATGSGKSTLLASIIRELTQDPDANRKILTYESPIEFVYDALQMPSAIVSQTEIPRHLPTFAAGVRNALRRKPHAILVGEARDRETIAAVLEAALTGHPVYTTLHSNGVAETIRRLVGSFPTEDRTARTIDIIETMRLIVWQQLVPTVDGKRTPLREYLAFTEEIRDILLDSNLDQITATTRQLVAQHGQPMKVDIESKYKDGIISDRTYKILCNSLGDDAEQ